MTEQLLTPKFRANYPNVLTAKLNDLNGKEEFSVQALFEKGADLSKLKAAAHAAAIEKWGKNKIPKTFRSPFRDQADKSTQDDSGNEILPPGHEVGGIFMNLKSIKPIGVIDGNKKRITEPSDVYSGCYMRAAVAAYAYDFKGNAGVAFGLRALQKVGEGEPLGGFVKAEECFEAVEGYTSDTDSGGDATEVENLFG